MPLHRMTPRATIAALALLALAACGRGENKDAPTAKQNADLDNAAAMLDGNQDIDTSPDSLVPEDANMSGMPEPGPPIGSRPSNASNGAAPARPAPTPQTNSAAPRR